MTATELPAVLLVCPVAEIGGAEQVTLSIARAMPSRGYRPILVTMRPGPLANVAGNQAIEAFEFPTPHRYRDLFTVARGVRWLVELARHHRAVLFHSTHTAHLYAGPAAQWLGLPEVWHHHDTPAPGFDWVRTMNRLLPTSHAIFTTRTVAAAHPWLTRGPHSVIAPICVDPAVLANEPDAPDVLDRLHVPSGRLLLTVARLQPHKGHADLLAAAAIVLRTHPDATFVIVGKASTSQQTAYLESLRVQADQLRIVGRVVFTGFVSDNDLAALYRRATALIHPARTEGYGLVLLEAMAMGTPVIAAAAAGPAEVIHDGDNGLLVPVANPPALAAAVRRVLDESAVRSRLNVGGRITSGACSLATMTNQTIDVLQRLPIRPMTQH